MAAGADSTARTEPSVVPLVREREAHLEQMLAEARRAADDIVQRAEREAAELLARSRDELPRGEERALADAVRRLEAEAETGRQALAGTGSAVRAAARQNLDDAVRLIVAAVWPED